jgi:SAM-dependent methyltransferase
MREDPRRVAPAVARNREPILAVLRRELPRAGLVLEVASGSGEHCAHFATALPRLVFQPSDPDPLNRASCDAWCAGLPNVRPALALDAALPDWPIAAAEAVLCINMAHVAPWAATLGLLRGAARLLAPGGTLLLYGPWLREGVPTAASNLAFDAELRARDPAWGLRALEDLAAAAARHFAAPEVREMPANNVMLVLRRKPARAARAPARRSSS